MCLFVSYVPTKVVTELSLSYKLYASMRDLLSPTRKHKPWQDEQSRDITCQQLLSISFIVHADSSFMDVNPKISICVTPSPLNPTPLTPHPLLAKRLPSYLILEPGDRISTDCWIPHSHHIPTSTTTAALTLSRRRRLPYSGGHGPVRQNKALRSQSTDQSVRERCRSSRWPVEVRSDKRISLIVDVQHNLLAHGEPIQVAGRWTGDFMFVRVDGGEPGWHSYTEDGDQNIAHMFIESGNNRMVDSGKI